MFVFWELLLCLSACFWGCWGDGADDFGFGGFVKVETDQKQTWNETDLDKLKKDLLTNYDKFARSNQNTTELQFSISIINLSINEIKSTMTLHGWLSLVWTDPKLAWDKSEYSNISLLIIGNHEIWQPDIFLLNSPSGGESLLQNAAANALVYPNGEVFWPPVATMTVLCDFDLRHWPFDEQTCSFKFGSWVNNGAEIKISMFKGYNYADTSDIFSNSTIWNITNNTAKIVTKSYDCCSEPYYYIEYVLTIKRQSQTYQTILLGPALVVAFLILVQFWLPPRSTEKLTIDSFICVISTIFLLYFQNQIGPCGSSTPLIVLFYSYNFSLITFAILGEILALALSQSKRCERPLSKLNLCLDGTLKKWLLLDYKLKKDDYFEPKSTRDNRLSAVLHAENKSKENSEKDLFLILTNRIYFVVYFCLYAISLLVLLL